MSKAQTDIRTTSYDAFSARPFGYQGTIDEVIAQIRNEPDHGSDPSYSRYELISFLGVNESIPSAGPSVELDQDVSYGVEDVTLGVYDPGFYSLANAKARGWL
jgi:hypothetical protein